MSPCRPEVADVFREHRTEFLARYGASLSEEQKRALSDIERCRTAALGGHKWRCENCKHEETSYNSCRNRHCPKCHAAARAKWLEAEADHLLPLEYFHLVFTLPADLGDLALRNKRQIYGALFRAAAEALATVAADEKHLGAEIGFLAVLHTWGQNLQHHPHLHCVVPGGGLSPDRSRWIPCRKGFFLPVRVLSRLFRGKFLDILEKLRCSGKLFLGGALAQLDDPRVWRTFLRALRQHEWVVYSKPPFWGAAHVLKYLARYTHGVAISNRRLISAVDGKVRFSWKDYAHGSKRRVMTLEAREFIRRFLLHVLPKGFVRIRHYGFLSNRSRDQRLEVIKALICESAMGDATDLEQTTANAKPAAATAEVLDGPPCPRCQRGRLVLIGRVRPGGPTTATRTCNDTS